MREIGFHRDQFAARPVEQPRQDAATVKPVDAQAEFVLCG
ncbi:hypothetical protein FHS99_001742 [Sphingomonas prati]|uniref:Uncharacterized protein n=1 Tax=Sphingomonas prati TaxID=1843237 RepID=A0A7W9BSS2_9SPHN|nr:hypothetical protein [Sphingomonas prati]